MTRSRPRIVPGDGDPRHGTERGYRGLGCRCEACLAGARAADIRRATVAPLAPDDPLHGTYTGYKTHRCRCGDCRQAAAEAHQILVARNQGGLAADDPRHGTQNGYSYYGCRCPQCRDANSGATRTRKARLRARASLNPSDLPSYGR